jgi:hypothetical protein
MHAARMAGYRARQREIVTHHGSPAAAVGDLLEVGATAMPRDDASPVEPPGRAMTQCHWCGRCCLLPLRQGFLRRCDHRRGRVGQVRTECKPPW